MSYNFLSYRRVKPEDAQMLMDWRTAPHVTNFMLTDIEKNLEKQITWIKSIDSRQDFDHRIIQIQGLDVGYCSITIKDAVQGIGELGVYIGDLSTPRELSVFNFLGTTNHAFYTMNLRKLANQVIANNSRTVRLQKFNGYEEVGILRNYWKKNEATFDVHLFEMTCERWHDFRLKFGYFKNWDGELT